MEEEEDSKGLEKDEDLMEVKIEEEEEEEEEMRGGRDELSSSCGASDTMSTTRVSIREATLSLSKATHGQLWPVDGVAGVAGVVGVADVVGMTDMAGVVGVVRSASIGSVVEGAEVVEDLEGA